METWRKALSRGDTLKLYPKLEQAGRRHHTILEEKSAFGKNKLFVYEIQTSFRRYVRMKIDVPCLD